MKKTKVMRLLSLLLVMTLISTCAISGTFAKYVTRASGEDQARVAKWGVLVTVDGTTFADKYAATDAGYLEDGGKYSVVSSVEGEQVVAPGTNSEQAGGKLVATVKGTPEVAARYTLEGKAVTDVVLKKGTYTDYTQLVKGTDGKYGYTGKFTLKKDYAPIKWNLVIKKGDTTVNVADLLYANLPAANIAQAEEYGLTPGGCSIFDAITIIQKVAGNEGYKNIVEAALGQVVSGGRNFELTATENKEDGTKSFMLSYDFDPNKEMDFTFELTWEWAFETDSDKNVPAVMGTVNEESVDVRDMADTYLGNVAAGVVTDDNASTTIKATFIATATQID